MGATPKRRRTERADPSMPASNQRFYCYRCGTAFSKWDGHFSSSRSPLFRGVGYIPFCKSCVDKMYDDYCEQLGDEREAVRRMCMRLDLYWSDVIYDTVVRDNGVQNRMRGYISKANLLKYIGRNFDDSLVEEAEPVPNRVAADTYRMSADKDADDVSPDVVEFWGAGYSPEFYADLERRYKDWTGGAEVAEPGDRALYRQICLLEAIIARDAADGRQVDKNINALNSLLGSMNLKPAQRSKESADAELEQMPLGVGIQKWEFSRPLPETPDNLKDVNGTIKNITTWFFGHACKMVGLRNSYCKMYEDAMEELRVKHPEYEEEDDDTLLNDIFGSTQAGGTT